MGCGNGYGSEHGYESENAYESGAMRKALGDTLRPGGFTLTEKAVRFCRLSPDDRVLDLGCGRGATVRYLREKHGICAVGVDPSEKLIAAAREYYPGAEFIRGRGEELPFAADSFACVLAECTLSLMDMDRAMTQVHRVLKDNGWFVITDVYARNPDGGESLKGFSAQGGMEELHGLPLLSKKLEEAGFAIALTEDWSNLLKELFVKITFSHGSMGAFWGMSAWASGDGMAGCRLQSALKACRPGYFLLISRKAGSACG